MNNIAISIENKQVNKFNKINKNVNKVDDKENGGSPRVSNSIY